MNTWKPRLGASFRTYQRPLGITELGFYWDSKFDGTADTVQHGTVEILSPENQTVFSHDNITRSWIALKQQFPLLGASFEVVGDQVNFIISANRLEACNPEEISLQKVASQVEAERVADALVNGDRVLSDDLLARIVILFRIDQISHVHILIHVGHSITDGMANATLLRTFLDIISSSPDGIMWDLEERLALALPSNDLVPGIMLNKARFRWHRAIGQTISAIRMSKINGGHTLPRKFTHLSAYTPARSGLVAASFSPEKSIHIIQNCRDNGITFGNAYPVLAQIALTRLLCRRFVRGDIGREEWEYRKREPMVTGGPLNLRPFLDREWYEKGGSTNVSLAIGFFFQRLPYMPLGAAVNLAPGDKIPSLQDLLPFPRFLLRCQSIRKQLTDLLRHPMFLHITMLRSQASIRRLQEVALNWRDKRQEAPSAISVTEQSPVSTHGGSSLGNMDKLIPSHYPLATEGEEERTVPQLLLHKTQTRLHCRPAELYLGASTKRQQLHIHVFWDMNVYDEDVVKEWLEEVREATVVYLGGETSPAIQKPFL
ncbi:hypothetical protein H0H81_010944 [Sphagnurus paluster]|uniref:Condensation domain-containing protein n=1 Tax=Sphagnurus paluster TaxID=117069 RepID=A0A9P7FVE3_9AGAR|nr:hypothetical protein H0H81_010944 [Sphagnurus paluster]